MITFILLASALFALGTYLSLSWLLRLPSGSTTTAIASIHGKQGITEKMRSALKPLANLLEKIFPTSEYRLRRMQADFERLKIPQTPQAFVAEEKVKALLPFVLGLLFLPLGVPWLTLLMTLIGLASYFRSVQGIRKRVEKLNLEIESELPRLVEVLSFSFKESRDLVSAFDRYRPVAGNALGEELDRLILNLNTGSHEKALRRMDSRLNIPSFTALTAILCGVHRGVDQETSLLMLEQDLRARERERMRLTMESSPKRIKTASFILTVLMIFMFMIPIALLIISNLTAAGL